MWREYHERTKHGTRSVKGESRHSYRLSHEQYGPLPCHYEGVPVLDLPADPPAPVTPRSTFSTGDPGCTCATDGPSFLSQLLFYSAAISASKRVPSTGDRYALRVNPSSGNLHPTEFHFLAQRLGEWRQTDRITLPSAHMAEQRALGDLEMKLAGSSAPIVFVLTSIVWREAWKYRDRAYRYCAPRRRERTCRHSPWRPGRRVARPLRPVVSRTMKSRNSATSMTTSGPMLIVEKL